jgi:predicted N-acetyltransferase YhbS
LSSPRLVRAEGAIYEQILDQTHRIWSDGLTRAAYAQYNLAQMRTRWGARHLQRLALVDGRRVLASAKRYDLAAVLDGRPAAVVGIGAVFTPPALRGRGHGRQMVLALLDRAREDGADLALLFSEIGSAYYERLGFITVPHDACELVVRVSPGAPAVAMRTGDDRDLPALADIHATLAARYRFSLRHDADWLQYAIARRRLLSGLGRAGLREVEFVVAEEGGRAVAWVLLQIERGRAAGGTGAERWTVESCGDRDPSGARVGALLQALLARAPAAPQPAIRAWWPAGLQPSQIELRPHGPSPITMMIRPVADGPTIDPPLAAATTLYWHADAF